MRGTAPGSLLAATVLVLTLSCSCSKGNPGQSTPPPWTSTGPVESISPPARLLFLLGDSIVQVRVPVGATVTGYGSLDNLYAAYRAGYQVQVKVTFASSQPSWEGEARRVEVLHVSDPLPEHFTYPFGGFNLWKETVLLLVGSGRFVVVDPSTVFRPDGDVASQDVLKSVKRGEPFCMDGEGFRLSDTDTRATTIRVWRSPDLYPACKAP